MMHQSRRLTAITERENDGFVALCPELDIASQGSSVEDARANLVEALTLFFEVAGDEEVSRRVLGCNYSGRTSCSVLDQRVRVKKCWARSSAWLTE